MDQPNRRDRRARRKALTAYVLDGPPKQPVCGQAKAAARRRAREANTIKPGEETRE